MEDTSKLAEPAVPSLSETPKPKRTVFPSKLVKILLLSLGCVVVFGAGVYYQHLTVTSGSQHPRINDNPKTSPNGPYPSSFPSISPSQGGKIMEVAVLENGKITTTKEFTFNPYLGNFGSDPEFYDGSVYFVDGNKLKKYSFETKSFSDVHTISAPDGFNLNKFSIEGNMLYLTFGPKESDGGKDVIIREINLSTGALRDLLNVKSVFYGTGHYLFKTKNGKEITASFGGDGCGGWGSFYRYENGLSTTITESGGGCVDKPRYYGFLKDREVLLFANGEISQEEDSTDINPFKFLFDVLYSLDVNTGTQSPIYDLKKIPNISEIIMNFEKTKLAIITDKDIRILDLTSNEIINTVPLKAEIGYLYAFSGNELYTVNHDTNTINVVDIDTQKITSAKLTKPGIVSFPYTILGAEDSRLYMYYIQY